MSLTYYIGLKNCNYYTVHINDVLGYKEEN